MPINTSADEWLETLDSGALPGPAAVPSPSFAGGRYHTLRMLGEGTQKQVLLARDVLLERQVVISVLKTEQSDPRQVARFWREAQTMARLGDHPHIVAVHDMGHELGRPYIVTEFVENGSLEDLLHGSGKRPLPLEQVLRLGEQVARALAHAHLHGVVHRDLKPANILLTAKGSAKLGDFGLALGPGTARLTMEGSLVGTVLYMAPEQALGQASSPQSDLYSLGALLYEMVTGRPPFLSDHLVGIVSHHLSTAPVAPSWHNPAVPESLEALVLKLLAKSPDDRPAGAESVAEALRNIAAAALDAEPAPASRGPGSLARLAEAVFVGRDVEMAELRTVFSRALEGRGQMILISGEPGAGKTFLTDQLATYAGIRRATVLTGRCYEGEGAPAFWPWAQVLRSYFAAADSAALAALCSYGAAELAQLAPEIRERLPGIAAPPPLEPDQARFRLFDSVTTLLKKAAALEPLVLILDDLHWADRPSLLLLQFLARELEGTRLLIVATYRDCEIGRRHPLMEALAVLARQASPKRIHLQGLKKCHVASFLEMSAGVEPCERLVDAVYEGTEGNPFYVSEVVKLLAAEGRFESSDETGPVLLPVPQSVREVIARRLDRLSPGCNRLLAIASVIGREFPAAVLETVEGISPDEALELLDEAVAARVIVPFASAPGRYRFVHALIRETLYADLHASEKARLHRRAGEALVEIYGSGGELHLPELAHHFLESARSGDPERAVSYAVRAGDASARQLAYEEAAGHYERALGVLEMRKVEDEKRRCEVVLALADAQTKAGNTQAGWVSFQRAAALARRLGAPQEFARAALGSGSWAMGMRYGSVDPVQVALLEESLRLLPRRDSALRARVLAQLSLAVYHEPGERRLAISQEAVRMARRVGEPAAQLAALFSRCITLEGYEKAHDRLAAATEIVRIARASGNAEMELRGHYRRLRELLELGDLAAVDREIGIYSRMASDLRQPIYSWLTPFCQYSRALLEGRFADCERLLAEARSIGDRAGDPNSALFAATGTSTLRRLQGRFAELEPHVRACVEKYPSFAGWRVTLAYLHSEMGRRSEAEAGFEALAARNFTDLPRDGAWLLGMALLAQTCAFLGDSKRAAVLYDCLFPFAGRNVVIGSAAGFYGPVSRQLGMLSASLRRWEQAAVHFEDALALSCRMGSRPFAAYSRYEFGAMLLARGRPEDRGRAIQMIGAASAEADALGMAKLAADAAALLDRSHTAAGGCLILAAQM